MTHRELHADAVRTLNGFGVNLPGMREDSRRNLRSVGQRALAQAFLGLLAARPDATARSCEPGHLTASVVLLNASRDAVLLTLHPRVGRWLQLGGHCEDSDTTLHGAALREATEESGIDGIAVGPDPIHLDVHPITCSLGHPTRHFDVRYLAIAPVGAVPAISAESDDLRFWPLDALPAELDGSLLAALTAASADPGVGR